MSYAFDHMEGNSWYIISTTLMHLSKLYIILKYILFSTNPNNYHDKDGIVNIFFNFILNRFIATVCKSTTLEWWYPQDIPKSGKFTNRLVKQNSLKYQPNLTWFITNLEVQIWIESYTFEIIQPLLLIYL